MPRKIKRRKNPNKRLQIIYSANDFGKEVDGDRKRNLFDCSLASSDGGCRVCCESKDGTWPLREFEMERISEGIQIINEKFGRNLSLAGNRITGSHEDGLCAAYSNSEGCLLHHIGYDYKPAVCRMFPISAHPDPNFEIKNAICLLTRCPVAYYDFEGPLQDILSRLNYQDNILYSVPVTQNCLEEFGYASQIEIAKKYHGFRSPLFFVVHRKLWAPKRR